MAVRGLEPGKKVALVVNECQRGIIDPAISVVPGLPKQVVERNMVANIQKLLKHFRAKKLPVFHTPFVGRPDKADLLINNMMSAISAKSGKMVPGTPESAYMPGLEPVEGEYVVNRTGTLIAFNVTELDPIMRRLGIQTVILTGVSTNIAIAGNTMTAVDHGYNVVIPEDCIAAGDPEAHKVFVQHQLRLLATITDSDSVIAAT